MFGLLSHKSEVIDIVCVGMHNIAPTNNIALLRPPPSTPAIANPKKINALPPNLAQP